MTEEVVDVKLTRESQKALSEAVQAAASAGDTHVDGLHLLAALVQHEGGATAPLLRAVGADAVGLLTKVREQQRLLPRARKATLKPPETSRQLLAALATAAKLATQMLDEYVSTEHLLVGLATDGGQAAELLRGAGAGSRQLTDALERNRGQAKVRSQHPDGTQHTLEKYGIDLTRNALLGELDLVIGRDFEIRRIMQVLSRRVRNNPVLVGEPGVGKTAVVEGLAQRIMAGDVPDFLRGKRVVALDLRGMAARAKYGAEFGERLEAVLNEIKRNSGQVITFIDQLHTVLGAGVPEGAMDAGNMLMSMLARGQLRLVGATTPDEYRSRIEGDPALERWFQRVLIGELSEEDTIAILRRMKGRYEAHHEVQISDGALVAAATLSGRYITARFQPDKAIDLIDEAASRLRMEIDSGPVEIDDLRRAVNRMKMEEQTLASESDPASRERLERLRSDLADREELLAALIARWNREKSSLNKIVELKVQLDDLRLRTEQAQRDADFETASRLFYGEIPSLERQIALAMAAEGAASVTNLAKTPMVGLEVGPNEVADIVSSWTGIPAGRLLEGEAGEVLPVGADADRAYTRQDASEQTAKARHVFMSCVAEDSPQADPLQHLLEAAGVNVWRPTADLMPGDARREKIRQAIKDASAFLACFSEKSVSRDTSYQNEELALAIDQMRIRRPDQSWLIPVRFDDCNIPDRDLGAGRTLKSIQRVDLFGDHANDANDRLIQVIRKILRTHD